MKFTIETTDISEAMAILANMEGKVEAPAQETKETAHKEAAALAHDEEAHKEAAALAHDDELANKRSEAAKKAAATKKAKAAKDKAAKDKAAEEADPLDDLGGLEDDQEDEAADLEMVQGALRAAIKANKENKIPVREYFKEHGIVGGVDSIPEELFNDCYAFAKGLM